MQLKNSIDTLSSYPILNNNRRDYLGTSFTSKISENKLEFGKLNFIIDFKLNDVPELAKLIDDGKAAYYIHLECTYTSYRTCFKTNKANFKVSLDEEKLSDKLEVATFIIANEAIEEYKSSKFNPIYGDISFEINKNQIMAIGNNYELNLENDDTDLHSAESIIRYRKLDDEKSNMKVITDDDNHIIIGLNKKTYLQAVSLGKNVFPMAVLSLIIIPAMIIVLQRMKAARDEDIFREKHWYQVLEKQLKLNNVELDELDVNSGEMFDVIQKLFDNPISRAVEELVNFTNDDN